MKIVAAAFVAASLLAGATGANAKPRENVQLRISADGVNFADPASVAKFRTHVARQIAAACNPGDRIGADTSPDFQCRKSMAAVSEVRIAALATQSNSAMATVE
jgi:UrcA family protein